VRFTTYHNPVPLSRNLGNLTSRNSLGPSGPVTGRLYILHEDQYTFLIISRSVLLRMRNVSDKICIENQNTFMFNIFFSPKTLPYMR